MNIAFVAPCPSPFTIGGAEKLYWDLERFVNNETQHRIDIIKLPSPEADLTSLLNSYRNFYELDLGGFDLIISGKYPAWMVQHPHHVIYLLHRLRGLYDTYPGHPAIEDRVRRVPRINTLIDCANRLRSGDAEPIELIETALTLLEQGDPSDTAELSFPGPISRLIIHALDDYGFAPERIQKYSSISHTVAKRPGYFPEGVSVEVHHPPSSLPICAGDGQRYLFTASRLDAPKRIDLLIQAMEYVRGATQLWIAGTGPHLDFLRALAQGNDRIKFLGHVPDNELLDLYRDAFGVLFAPKDEDYGLIAVEAMSAGKPIITTDDSGGPTELVVHGRNGWVVSPTPEGIGAAISELIGDPEEARRRGADGLNRSQGIHWKNFVDWLQA